MISFAILAAVFLGLIFLAHQTLPALAQGCCATPAQIAEGG
jgi:hypothetical protein